MTVNVRPMPSNFRDIPAKLRPQPAPIFPDGEPSAADVQEALALFRELDAESQSWYLREGGLFHGIEPAAVRAKPQKRSRGA